MSSIDSAFPAGTGFSSTGRGFESGGISSWHGLVGGKGAHQPAHFPTYPFNADVFAGSIEGSFSGMSNAIAQGPRIAHANSSPLHPSKVGYTQLPVISVPHTVGQCTFNNTAAVRDASELKFPTASENILQSPIGMEINGKQIPVPAANATHGTPHSTPHATPRAKMPWVQKMDKFADGVDATLHAGKAVGKPIMGFAKGTAKVALGGTILLGALGLGIGALADRSAERSL